MPTIINALGAVPKKDSDKLPTIMNFSRPPTMNANSYIDLEHYKYVVIIIIFNEEINFTDK